MITRENPAAADLGLVGDIQLETLLFFYLINKVGFMNWFQLASKAAKSDKNHNHEDVADPFTRNLHRLFYILSIDFQISWSGLDPDTFWS